MNVRAKYSKQSQNKGYEQSLALHDQLIRLIAVSPQERRRRERAARKANKEIRKAGTSAA